MLNGRVHDCQLDVFPLRRFHLLKRKETKRFLEELDENKITCRGNRPSCREDATRGVASIDSLFCWSGIPWRLACSQCPGTLVNNATYASKRTRGRILNRVGESGSRLLKIVLAHSSSQMIPTRHLSEPHDCRIPRMEHKFAFRMGSVKFGSRLPKISLAAPALR
jgi:hypothetical protein